MHRPLAPLALAAVFLAPSLGLHAQQPQRFDDPANLTGERTDARTGRELPIDGGEGNRALGLAQMLRRLQTRASILNIVAHPDDEDGGMLTFYARGMGARVADLALTRGEGGQNAMTGDFEDALGLLRTQELLANDRYTGVEQMFGTEVDFGFSKTKAEAFSKWTHERCLYDAVRAIRIFRPLVITATFVGAPTDGHGQHQVSGEIAQEAFLAAGDPKVFPELTAEGILPWQPLKMYARVPRGAISDKGLYDYATNQFVPAEFTNYITHETSKTPPTSDVVVHEGQQDTLLTVAATHRADLPKSLANSTEPMTYVQFARIGLSLQKSQIGPGDRTAGGGAYDVHYHRYGSKLVKQPDNEQSFFDGIDTSLLGIQGLASEAFPTDLLANAARAIQSASEHFDASHPESAAQSLALAKSIFDHLIPSIEKAHGGTEWQRASALHELRVKQTQLNDALALAISLSADATVDTGGTGDIVEGSPLPIHTTLTNDPTCAAEVEVAHITAGTSTLPVPPSGAVQGGNLKTSITRPYFFRKDHETPVYTLSNAKLRNAPATPPALTYWVQAKFRGTPVEVGRVVHDGDQAIRVVPRLNLSIDPTSQPLASGTRSLTTRVTASPAEPAPLVALVEPMGWKNTNDLKATHDGTYVFHIQLPPAAQQRASILAAATVLGPGLSKKDEHFAEGYRPVGYGDLPRTNLFIPAREVVTPMELALPRTKLRIGFVPGTGDAVPESLQSVGLSVATLTVADLNAATLASYDTVILGVRTYNAHPDLHGAPTRALLDFARAGGNVVVEYQTPEFTAADAPYPLSLGDNEKVVDETAPVKLLTPNSAEPWTQGLGPWTLLSTPNKLAPADFNGWIEERGHGFMGTWDPHYTALTETGDPGSPAEHVAPQKPQRGGLLTVRLDKGRWTYLAFAVYRQLPEAVPGAYRLMVNLIDGR